MKFLRRKDNKSETPPPPPPAPPVIPDAAPQLDALPAPPPPLYARFATGSSRESLDDISASLRPKMGAASPQSRDSFAPSVNTTSTNSSNARPVIKLVNKPRGDDTTTTSQPSRTHTDSRTNPPTRAYRRETSSSEGTRLAKPRPQSTSNLPNPFLPPLLRTRNSRVDVQSAESSPTTFNTGAQQVPHDASQKRIDLGTPVDIAVQALPPGAKLPRRPTASPTTSPTPSSSPYSDSASQLVTHASVLSSTKREQTSSQVHPTLAITSGAQPNPIAPTAIDDTANSPPAAPPVMSSTGPERQALETEAARVVNRPPAVAPSDVDLIEPPFVPLKANGPLPVLSNHPSPTSSSFSSPPAKSDLSRRVSVSLYDPPVPKFTPDPDRTPSSIPTPPLSARGVTAQWPQRGDSLLPTPITPTELATPNSSQALPSALNRTRERSTNKLQKSTRPASPPPSFKRESMQVAPKSVDKRLSSLQLVAPTHTPTIRNSLDTTSTPAQTSVQPPTKSLPASNSFYGAMPAEIVPNTQLLSPVSPSAGPPQTQSQPHVETKRALLQQHPPAPKTDPIALPPANPELPPTRPAAPPAQSTKRTTPRRKTSAINSPAVPASAPAHVPGPNAEPANAVAIDPSPSRQSSERSMTSASTAPSQVLKTPSDIAQEQEQEQVKLPPESKSSTTLARAPNRVDERAADVDIPPVVKRKTKRKDGNSRVSRNPPSSHGHEHEHEHEGKEKETGELPSPASKINDTVQVSMKRGENDVVQVLVKRREKSRKGDESDAPASTVNAPSPITQRPATAQRSPSPQPPSQQSPMPSALPPPKSTPIPPPAPFKAPPSALLQMHMPSRRRQASSPISKSEVEAARALGVVLFYPLEKHMKDPSLLEELLAYLSFQEFMALSSASKRIRMMLEDRKELREAVLDRYLATVGYTRWEFETKEPLELTLKDLNSYLRGVSIPVHRYAEIAETAEANKPGEGTKSRIVRLLASSTRAYCRVVLRLRAQAEVEAVGDFASSKSSQASAEGSSSHASQRPVSPLMRAQMPPRSWKAIFQSPLYRPGHAPLLRVFVPSPDGPWLSDDCVLACEKELKRAGVVSLLKAGDVVWDTAVSDEACYGNVARLIWDGNYLIDLDYSFSNVGEMPPYLHSFSFPPSYFHRILRSAGNPIVQLDIRPWGREIAMNLHLVQDRGHAETPQGGRHVVVRWTHRSKFQVVRNTPIPDTQLVVDPAWEGSIVIECEGTNEGLADLQVRAGLEHFKPQAGVHPQPGDGGRVFRLLREKSRPSEIWVRCVRQKEKII